MIRTGPSIKRPTERVQPAIKRDRRHFGADCRKRRFHRPSSERRLTVNCLNSNQARDHNCEQCGGSDCGPARQFDRCEFSHDAFPTFMSRRDAGDANRF
jgi:hypothetical protein